MASLNQLLRKQISKVAKKSATPALNGRPQRKGLCIKVMIMKPKKPNSAQRKIARVKIDRVNYLVYIPGIGHQLQEHASVLIRGGKTKDLPGLRYKVIRGKLDCTPVYQRVRGRSLYGVKRPAA
eukprot:Opistho-1_new@34446